MTKSRWGLLHKPAKINFSDRVGRLQASQKAQAPCGFPPGGSSFSLLWGFNGYGDGSVALQGGVVP